MISVAAREDSTRGPAVGYADPLGEPFLRTRFAVPARPATFVRRPRLTAHLDQALDTPLTMVNGAAGAGKTLLVADWAAGLGQPVAWLTNEAGDQGPGMFWAYVLHALHTAGTPLPAGIGGSPGGVRMVDHRLLARLADELNGRDRPAILVLDEFDRLAAPETAEQLEFVLHHAGRGLRLILVTRTEPLLPLHRYRAAAAMTEIRNQELAFTPEEAADLLARHGLRLPADAARALVERTRGWAAGLRLSALAAQQSTDPETYLKEFEAGHSTIADFLLAEVVGRQPPETQDLLLRVSVLDRFGPELAEALTGRPDAGPLLAGLCRQNAFVEDLGHSWYRLHPLFGEILRVHLRAHSPGLEPELHRRAARWLRAHGAVPEALAHGAAAADWECTAGVLVDDLAIGRLLTGLRADDLTGLFSGMGPEATGAAVDLVRAARELSEHDLDHGLAHLGRAEESLAAGATAAGRLSCVLLESLAARLTGSPDRAEQAVSEAARLRREVPPQLLAKHPELTALLLTHLGSARVWAGHFDAARAALTEVADLPGDALTELPREDCLGHLALIDYFDGRPDRAESRALAATDATRHCGGRPFPGAGLGQLVLAAVAVDRDELGRARALLAEAAEYGPGPGVPDPVTEAYRALVTGRLHLALGDPAAAAHAADPAVRTQVPSPWAEANAALAAAAVLLAEGRPGRAAEVLDGIERPGGPVCAAEVAWARLAAGHREEAVETAGRLCTEGRTGPGVTVRAALVRARAAAEAGDTGTARKLLARALLEARRDRLRRPFLDAGPGIRRLLDAPPLHGLAAAWLYGDGPGADSPPLLVEELSGREREVLGRLAQMMSTQEIAADLYVSVNTVKTHLKSIYRKLGVGRRGDAVRRARERGLL
ncbi:LuxR C-terminal-related transcriptional regulator [Streptomyces sp. GbtcB6]|uniref:helix-turn-helix transcriptional regulator n=1 Tax=Streptomyces sp. GbtcB6 TaxID=2824751 RepID=UPI0027E50293|nr:LuxR C-terminal-related transcriptional regulator [Streptomyces sp. GbtcB6]